MRPLLADRSANLATMSAMVLLSSLAGCGGEGVAGGSAPHPNRDTTYQTLSAVDTDNTPSSHNVINASISVNTHEVFTRV